MEQRALLAIFTYPAEMLLIQTLLDSNNIQNFAQDEITIQVDNFLSNAMGGIRLFVAQEDYKNAHTLLTQGGYQDYLAYSIDGGPRSKAISPKLKIAIIAVMLIVVLFFIIFFSIRIFA